MGKQSNLQFELFSQPNNCSETKNQVHSKSFLSYIWNYEKAILIIIGMAIISIASFSFGVEKGKRLSMPKSNSRLDVALAIRPPATGLIEKHVTGKSLVTPKEQVQEIPKKKEDDAPEQQGYTIQLASYKSKRFLQKEVESLKKRGLSPLVLLKGNYTVLCVGNFPDRKIAQSLLSELKKQYKDCYIRRL